jgi:hypothetical protein
MKPSLQVRQLMLCQLARTTYTVCQGGSNKCAASVAAAATAAAAAAAAIFCPQDKNAVFVGTFGALAIMTVISVALGQVTMIQI